jgi:hypothetical protein
MSLLNGHDDAAGAREVLDFCLSNESPELRAKVYEIIGRSGLDPSDPMFLVLALTGQMRVFLEAAPLELNLLLENWKNQSASSLSEITSAIANLKQAQQEQAEAIRSNMEAVSSKYVTDIKEAGMATTSAIAEANSETLEQVTKTKKQVEDLSAKLVEMDAKFDEREQRRIDSANGVVKWTNSTTQKQETVNQQVGVLISEVAKIQRNKVWLRIADVFWSFPALVACMSIAIGGTWWIASRRYNHPNNVFGRDVVDWNVDRINHCYDTNNPKCTVWIVPPDSPKREGAE